MTRRRRLMVLSLIAGGAALFVAALGPIAQPRSYHQFADTRRVAAIPNFWNVCSNVIFVLVGVAGLSRLLKGERPGVVAQLRPAYLTLFAASIFVGLGSAFYHLDPDNNRLAWDRLPMTVAFMAFFSIVVGEHISIEAGSRFLVPLVALGILSVWYWQFTEGRGEGDLRPYALIQFLPLLLVPLVLLLFPFGKERDGPFWGVLAGYTLAKTFELLDRPLFEITNGVSGHVLKHVAAAAALFLMLVAIERPVPAPAPEIHGKPDPTPKRVGEEELSRRD